MGKAFLALALTAICTNAQAAVVSLGVNFDNTGQVNVSGPNIDIGWEFSISSAISVSQLGFWDAFGDGLGEAHSVAIWSASGAGDLASALVSGTVAAGTVVPFSPGTQFRMIDVTPTFLGPGTYVIGARVPGIQVDGFKDGASVSIGNLAYGSGITFVEKRYGNGGPFAGPFARPDSTGAGAGLFGPNFAYTEAVPEASSMALAALGVVGLAGWNWRRKKSS
jgi:hypothetical protein